MPQSLATSKHSCSDFDNFEMDVGMNVLMIMHVNDILRLSFGISDNHEYYSFTSATANTLKKREKRNQNRKSSAALAAKSELPLRASPG